jgi:hypothetical protein
MQNEHVIRTLVPKRAKLSGDLAQLEARVHRCQTEMGAVDVTLRLFDPDQRPATIKPVARRAKPPRFWTGEFSRSVTYDYASA